MGNDREFSSTKLDRNNDKYNLQGLFRVPRKVFRKSQTQGRKLYRQHLNIKLSRHQIWN